MSYFVGQIFFDEFPQDACDWVNNHESGRLYGKEIEPDENGRKRFQICEMPQPTPEEIEAQLQKQMTDAVQYALDAFAKTRGYDGIMSACSYSNSTDAQFKLEADYCIQLRDTTWRMGYAILAEVKADNRPVPTVEELIAELPVGSAKWPDEQ